MLWAEKGKRIKRALRKSSRGRSGFLRDSEPLPNIEDSARQKLCSIELGRCSQGFEVVSFAFNLVTASIGRGTIDQANG